MADHDDGETGSGAGAGTDVPPTPEDIDDTPTVSCSRCGREWDLEYELDELRVGNQAVEQFALDHERHTGHYPDGIATWRADCEQCPDGVEHLSDTAARRWARTHARHTRHEVRIHHATEDETTVIGPDDDGNRETGADADGDAGPDGSQGAE